MTETDTGKKTTYAWIFADQKGTTIDCYKSDLDSQTVCKLWETGALSAFHDADLAAATSGINAIIGGVERGNGDPGRKLSFIKVENRLMLVWARYGAIGPADDLDVIKKAFRLQ